ncbi:MAG: hypothetical protein GYB31_15025 [Bacteroidetes bacterium]|nr:hypothetical protein [Bacteroidota bacterium]
MGNFQHKENFQVRTYEIDNHKRITLVALVRLMHEAAMQNVINLGLSVWDLEPQKISWVLMRKKLWVDRLPVLGDKISIFTTPAGFNRSFTYRDYIVYDAEGNRLAAASSTWLLMDTEARKMAPLPPFIKDYEKFMPDPKDCLPRPGGRLTPFTEPKWTNSFCVNWHDLDFNNHLSNIKYLEWMLEGLPASYLQTATPLEMRIEYKSESLLHQHILSEVCEVEENNFVHRLKSKETDQILCLATSKWHRP